ncbi:MAG: exodeoxyribonuclease I, partial [Spirochaetales bacterium]|nr:exodeoxyribonuclease I [Spirochaetales bacterium]
DPDVSIYSSMVSDPDKAQLSKIKKLSPEAMLKSGEHLFDDDKYHKLLWRYVARNYPKALSPEDLAKWKNFCALRLINPPVQEALTLDKYQRTVDELLNSLETTAEQKKILMQLKEYGEILEKRVLN